MMEFMKIINNHSCETNKFFFESNMSELIFVKKFEKFAVLSLNNKVNPLSASFMGLFLENLIKLEEDKSIEGVIIKSEHEKVFCAGLVIFNIIIGFKRVL
jgi:enoyl-CoA hydratase/carnithine racemase